MGDAQSRRKRNLTHEWAHEGAHDQDSTHEGWLSLLSALQGLPTEAPTKRPAAAHENRQGGGGYNGRWVQPETVMVTQSLARSRPSGQFRQYPAISVKIRLFPSKSSKIRWQPSGCTFPRPTEKIVHSSCWGSLVLLSPVPSLGAPDSKSKEFLEKQKARKSQKARKRRSGNIVSWRKMRGTGMQAQTPLYKPCCSVAQTSLAICRGNFL